MSYRQPAASLPHTSVLAVDRELRFIHAEGEGRRDGVNTLEAGAHLVGQLAYDALSPAMWEVAGPHYRSALDGQMAEFDAPGGPGGESIHVRTLPLWGPDEVVNGALIITERVAEQHQAFADLHEAQAFNEAVFAASPDLMIVLNLASGEWEWSSRNVWSALGWDAETTDDVDLSLIMRHVVDDDLPIVHGALAALGSLPHGESLTIRFRLRGPDRTRRWISCRATPFDPGDGVHGSRALATLRDVTRLVEIEQRLRHSALHDPLTGLPNRAGLIELIASSMRLLDTPASGLALLFCDLDGFKHINDTYGHATGDEVLVEVAFRLKDSLRKGDSVARVGGDEFVVLLAPLRTPPEPGAAVADGGARFRPLAERIQDRVSQPFDCDGNVFELGLSIGVTLIDQRSDAAEVLSEADAAMYRAKKLGAGRIEIFDQELQSARRARRRIETALLDALSPAPSGTVVLSVAYQPVFDIEPSRLVGFEALARLSDKDGRSIDPEDFIPVAEDLGLIHVLDQQVLEIALGALNTWTAANPDAEPITMAVNVSASQAHSVTLAPRIRAALVRHDIAPSSLVIEVTESVLVDLSTSTVRQLRELHDLGVAIAIDDFGTGYASLQYLITLPVDVIKVDRCFIRDLGTDPTNTAIVRAVAALAHDLDVACIVEGIETQDQLDALPHGVQGQGFLLGSPHATMRADFLPHDQAPPHTSV